MCAICEIASGQGPGRVIYRDGSALAFLAKDPEVRAHTVVAPIAHVATWHELGEELVRDLFVAAQEVSRRLCLRLSAGAVNVLFAGGPVAQQSVPHFHLHILPRWPGDGVDAWPRLPGYGGDLEADLHALVDPESPARKG